MRRPWRIAVTVLVAGAVVVLAPSAVAMAESQGRVLAADDAPAHEVAIIFGAQVKDDGQPARYTAARLDRGVELYRRGAARVLVVSGDNRPEHNEETAGMRRYLEARGVPSASIVEDTGGVDTYDTCVRARDVFGITSALLISQEYHLARAVATCRLVGIDAVGAADVSVKGSSLFWPFGVAREVPANIKMLRDVLSRRAPLFPGEPDSAVTEALR